MILKKAGWPSWGPGKSYPPKDKESYTGYALYFHSDFIRSYPSGKAISHYSFFAYEVSEALCLSAREKQTIQTLLNAIAEELSTNIDHFSQDVW